MKSQAYCVSLHCDFDCHNFVLDQNLEELRTSIYNPDSEATCRIGIDLMLLQCTLLLQRKLLDGSDKTKSPRTPSKRTRKNHVSLFPEAEINVDVKNRCTGEVVKVNGRADWAFGYGTKYDSLGC